MNNLKFNELRAANLKRLPKFGHGVMDWSPTDWGCAMAGECGEACNKVKKLKRGDDVTKEEIGDELADTIIYADLLAARLGIDLGEAVVRKFNEVSEKRNLPVKMETV